MYLIGKKLVFKNPGQLGHYCPACDDLHFIETYLNGTYRWNESEDRPTILGLVSFIWGDTEFQRRCCYSVTLGEIRYRSTSTHEYAGKTIKLPNIDRRIIESYEIQASGAKIKQHA
jgi:hypothetical protein